MNYRPSDTGGAVCQDSDKQVSGKYLEATHETAIFCGSGPPCAFSEVAVVRETGVGSKN